MMDFSGSSDVTNVVYIRLSCNNILALNTQCRSVVQVYV